MGKGEKVLISVMIGIALINFYLQHKSSIKLEEFKNAIINK